MIECIIKYYKQGHRIPMKTSTKALSISVLCICLAGCSGKQNQDRAILNNLTPNMDGIAETYAQNDSGIAVVVNENIRMVSDDLRRLFLLDKPSMLTPYPVVDN